MPLTGEQIIGHQLIRGQGRQLLAINPATEQAIPAPVFNCANANLVKQACELADQAFDSLRSTSPERRAQLLEAIADGIVGLGATLLERAHSETGLPLARLEGERGRTVGQLRLFASVLRQGRWQQATFDSALPDRAP
ncbi:MAG: aldehyde dehydrogenase family protein, partial [Pseudomonas sp.]